jgi:hypothetical protein
MAHVKELKIESFELKKKILILKKVECTSRMHMLNLLWLPRNQIANVNFMFAPEVSSCLHQAKCFGGFAVCSYLYRLCVVDDVSFYHVIEGFS